MGLERLACVVQGVGSLFDVDTVRNITNKVSEIAGKHYGESDKTDVSLRVITDHIRSATFMICDGVLPSNEGRGYVLRRLLRRAARHGKLLGVNDPFLYKVCDTVIHENEGHYPELRERQDYIVKVIRVEEENFARTIDGGLRIFNDMLTGHKEKGEKVFSGADAFKLYDTYGFPIDLTLEMVEEQDMTLDEKEFHKQMEEQRQRARKAREALGDLGWAGVEFGKDVPETVFDGYEHGTLTDVKVVALVVENEQAEEMMTGVEGIVVLDKTPFYAEMGGQVADHGQIVIDGDKPCCFEVTDVQKNKGGKYMHYGKVVQGVFKLGDMVRAQIDTQRRAAVMRAHSATHLLDTALRSVLGDHVHQAGSLVEPDRLRFDFTHFSAVTAEELMQVESIVNDAILSGYRISTETLPIEEAKKRGAIALFGEKYGDTVRVVDMGEGFSVEFCGGTHLDNTAKAGMFKIIGEASVAAGVRRIEAVTGKAVLRFLNERQHILNETAAALKTSPNELASKVEQTMNDLRAMGKKLEKLNGKIASMQIVDLFNVSRDVKDVNVVATKLEDATPDMLRTMGDSIKEKAPNMVAVLSSVSGDKVSLLCVCGAEAVQKGAHAGKIVKEVAKLVGGGGGGRPDSATAGGKDPSKLEAALEAVNNIVDALL